MLIRSQGHAWWDPCKANGNNTISLYTNVFCKIFLDGFFNIIIQISPRALRQYWINIFFLFSQENLIHLTSNLLCQGFKAYLLRVSLLQNPACSSTVICILLQCSFPSLVGYYYECGTTTQLLKLRTREPGFIWTKKNCATLKVVFFICGNRDIPPFFMLLFLIVEKTFSYHSLLLPLFLKKS